MVTYQCLHCAYASEKINGISMHLKMKHAIAPGDEGTDYNVLRREPTGNAPQQPAQGLAPIQPIMNHPQYAQPPQFVHQAMQQPVQGVSPDLSQMLAKISSGHDKVCHGIDCLTQALSRMEERVAAAPPAQPAASQVAAAPQPEPQPATGISHASTHGRGLSAQDAVAHMLECKDGQCKIALRRGVLSNFSKLFPNFRLVSGDLADEFDEWLEKKKEGGDDTVSMDEAAKKLEELKKAKEEAQAKPSAGEPPKDEATTQKNPDDPGAVANEEEKPPDESAAGEGDAAGHRSIFDL